MKTLPIWIALSLLFTGMVSLFTIAVIHLVDEKNPWFLVICLAGLFLLIGALWPIRKQLKSLLLS